MSFNSNCKAGYKCTDNGKGEICPAGTFAKAGDTECTPCQKYYWSDKGSEKCNKIMIKIRYGHDRGTHAIYDNAKWFWGNSIVHCNNATFGDPIVGQKKYCGFAQNDFAEENQTFKLNCKKIPCDLYGNKSYFYARVHINDAGDADLQKDYISYNICQSLGWGSRECLSVKKKNQKYLNYESNRDLMEGVSMDLEGMASWDGSHENDNGNDHDD